MKSAAGSEIGVAGAASHLEAGRRQPLALGHNLAMRIFVLLLLAAAASAALDLTNAVVVAPDLQGREKKALELLLDEVQARTRIRWDTVENSRARPLVRIANGRSGPAEGNRLGVSGANLDRIGYALNNAPCLRQRIAGALNEATLSMRYENLDGAATYAVRITYGGDPDPALLVLTADDDWEVHAAREKGFSMCPVEFPIPSAATADGALTLKWRKAAGGGGPGRGLEIAEVWLVRK